MLARAILLLMPVAAFSVSTERGLANGATYDRCDAANGPAAWPGKCPNQMSGTPINLCGAVAFPAGPPTISLTGYTSPITLTIGSDGSSITVTVPSGTAPPTIAVGNLSALVGRSTNTSTQIWNLQQMHMHWGRTGQVNEGSEHYLQGTQYAAEAHFVHYNSMYGSFTAAVASGNSDALLVVGVFLQAGGTDSNLITAIANAATTVTKTQTPMSTSVTLSDMFDGTGDFYSYGGSLTTPTCLEIVTWIVMTQAKGISTATLEKLYAASTSPGTTGADTIGKYGNWRPLQPLGSRTLYNSAGASAACSAPTEPTFNCNKAASSGTLSATPLVSVHFALLMLATWVSSF